MKTRLLGFAALLWLCPAGAHASIITYGAVLNGLSESPPNASPGTGHATVITNDIANTMRVIIDFMDLIGTTTASGRRPRRTSTAAPRLRAPARPAWRPRFLISSDSRLG